MAFYSKTCSANEDRPQLHQVDDSNIYHSLNTNPGPDVFFDQQAALTSRRTLTNASSGEMDVVQKPPLKQSKEEETTGSTQSQSPLPSTSDSNLPRSQIPTSQKVSQPREVLGKRRFEDVFFDEDMEEKQDQTDFALDFVPSDFRNSESPSLRFHDMYEGLFRSASHNYALPDSSFLDLDFKSLQSITIPSSNMNQGFAFNDSILPGNQSVPPTDQVVAFNNSPAPVNQYAAPVDQYFAFNNGAHPANQDVAPNDYAPPANQDGTLNNYAPPYVNEGVVLNNYAPHTNQDIAPYHYAPPANEGVVFNNYAPHANQDGTLNNYAPPVNEVAFNNYAPPYVNHDFAPNNQNDGAPDPLFRQNAMRNHQGAIAGKVKKLCQQANSQLFARATETLNKGQKEEFKIWVGTYHKNDKTWITIKSFLNTNLYFGDCFVKMICLFLSEEFRIEYEESLGQGRMNEETQDLLKEEESKVFYRQKFTLIMNELKEGVAKIGDDIKKPRRAFRER